MIVAVVPSNSMPHPLLSKTFATRGNSIKATFTKRKLAINANVTSRRGPIACFRFCPILDLQCRQDADMSW